jgi:rubrerythrin
MMNLQDFACRISDIVWGGELGWDRKDGLEKLAEVVKNRFKKPQVSPSNSSDLLCAKNNKAKLLYSDRSPVDTYECQHCAKEFTMLEGPLYCPLCGVKLDIVD